MLDRILVPLDGSPAAEAILPHVRRLLHESDSEVVLFQTVVPIAADTYAPALEVALGAAKAYLEKIGKPLAESGARVRTLTDVGSAPEAILRAARTARATLLALATHGRTGLSRAVLGSVAEQVLRTASVPVLAVRSRPGESPRPVENRPIRNILVPLDGSARAFLGLAPAMQMGRLFAARVILLHVLERARKDAEPAGTEILRQAADRVKAAGIPVLTILEKGAPAKVILETSRFHEVDLIGMATHGRSGMARLVAGSVTESVLRESPVALLVVPTKEPAKDSQIVA